MTRSRRLLLGVAAYLLFVYGYVLLFCVSSLPSVRAESGEPLPRLALLFAQAGRAMFAPGEVLGQWFGAPGEFGLADRLPVLLTAGGILGCATAAGWLLMALCRADRGLDRLERYVFSTAVGLNAISTYVLAVGLLGGLGSRWVFAIPAAVVLAMAGWLWRQRRQGRRQGRWEGDRPVVALREPEQPAAESLCLGFRWLWPAAPFVLLILLGGMLPPWDFDVREYHLQVPKEFYQQGYIGFLPHNVYGNMPMGSEMHSLLAMVITGDWWLGALAGKTVIAAMAPLTALGLLAAGRRFFTTAAGVVAAVLYISIPWIVQVSAAGLIDGAVALYLLMSIYAVLLWADGGAATTDGGSRTVLSSRLLLAGYLAGGAAACKYPAVLFVLLPLGVWVFVSAMTSRLRPLVARGAFRARLVLPWRPVGVFLLAALLGCGLWFGKNWVFTGNPTYPLLYGTFGGKSWTPEKDRQWNRVHRPRDFSPARLGRDLARVGLRSEWLSPLVVPLAVLAMVPRRRRRLVVGLLVYFGYVIAAWWLLTHRIDRFWIPTLPVLALLAGVGACWNGSAWWRRFLIVLLGLGLAANFLVADAIVYRRYCVRLDLLRRDPERVSDPWHRYLNSHAAGGRVLLVGEAQPFDFEVPVVYGTCFDDCPLEQFVRGRSAEEIGGELAARGITHVYVDWFEIARYRRPGNYGFTDFVQRSVFEDLVAQGILEPLPPIEGDPGRGYRVQTD